MSATAVDYYHLLQVDPEADPEVVEAAYRRLARKYHPDLNPGADAGSVMRQLNEAYAVLGDAVRREAYDRARRPRGQRRPVRQARPAAPRPSPPPPPANPPARVARLPIRRQYAVALAGSVALAIAFAALVASLFRPGDFARQAEAPTPGVYVVTRAAAPDASPTIVPRATATPVPWPPFPLDAGSYETRSGPSADAVAAFIARAREAGRSLLVGPRAPTPPAPPVGPG